jgi:nucleoside-diphosphate-sugar epimerase
VAALGRTLKPGVIDEHAHWEESKLNSNYAESKHKAEIEVQRGVAEGLHAVIVNPGVILGIGDCYKGSLALIGSVWKGLPFYSEGMNGYVDADDVARFSLKLMQENSTGRFILVSESVVMKNLLDMMADALDRKRPSVRVNPLLAELAWMSAAVLRLFKRDLPEVTRETARASQKKYQYSSQKAIAATGLTFKPLQQCIREACTDFLNQIHKP